MRRRARAGRNRSEPERRSARRLTYLLAAVLGIVQGLTEFLPISSTAHLLLVGQALGFQDPGGVFTVMIQFGSVLAVMWLYRAKIIDSVLGLPSDPAARRFALMLIIASIPAGLAGVLLSDWVKGRLYHSPAVIASAFIIGGIAILMIERFRPTPVVFEADKTPVPRAFAVGVCQMLALVPGVSRSGATIMGGVLAGLDRPAAAEFSFFLAMPALAGAFVHDLWEVRDQLAPERGAEIAIGFVMAFLAALVVVKPFVRYVARNGFAPFAWYRIVAGVLILLAIGVGWL
jgi:undecaprenyl-diphosphatase